MAAPPATVVVTGAAAGIGRATAIGLAERGFGVLAVDRDQAGLESLAAESGPSQSRGSIDTRVVDVSSRDQLRDLAAFARQTYGELGGLVCAAGLQRYGTVTETSDRVFDDIIEVNIGGVFFACRELIPLISAGGGVVVVSSVQAFAVQRGVAAYAMGKAALIGLVKAMALDHAKAGVRVNAVCPGSVDTPMLRSAAELFAEGRTSDEVVAEWGRNHPLGRVAEPSEVADAIAYLISDQASFVTGTELRVDGGLTAGIPVAITETTEQPS
jgi:NAD(P)-dependent dehydrogenase (short-subunit alcohol dehydrogenase family)